MVRNSPAHAAGAKRRGPPTVAGQSILEEGRIRNRRLARLLIIGTGNLGLFDFGTGTQSFALLFLFF